MFFDQARVYVKGGDGGNGVVAFRREIYVPKGGPNGGNGGRGGHVYFVVDPQMNTLHALKNQVHYRAERGTHGSGADKFGAMGKDLRIPVPPGTVVRDAETGDLIVELMDAGQEFNVAAGGRGGRGNAAFKTDRNRAPRIAENGEKGQDRWLAIELKLVADVGIIGVPNAGKSTLLSVVSAAKPKIAAYPFTTVTPNLGVAEVEHRQIVLVDIPGLLEGAHEGVGLGLDFLRHIERTRMLIHVLGGDSPDPLGDFEAINQEMELFNPALLRKQQLVVFNKMDLPEAQALWPQVEQAIQARGVPVLSISAATQQNIRPLLYQLLQMMDALPAEERVIEEAVPEVTAAPDEKAFSIIQLADNKWLIEGVAVERAAQMTNWTYYESAMRFQRILKAMHITQALRDAGVQDGHTIRINELELVWGYENAFGE